MDKIYGFAENNMKLDSHIQKDIESTEADKPKEIDFEFLHLCQP